MTGEQAMRGRFEQVQGELVKRDLDALLVDAPVDLRYVSGYTGSNGLALIRVAEAGPSRFLTDFRYAAQSEAEVAATLERSVVTGELRDSLPGLLGEGGGRLGVDEAKLTVKAYKRLRDLLPASWELESTSGLIERLRVIKEPGEIELIAAACALADQALTEVLEAGLVGRTEREVALDLETRMRRLGADAPSFSSIVASGAHGALPHAQPRDVAIPADVLVTIDWGAIHQGYCSDCTRTYATGEGISAKAREIYELVLRAQLAAVAAVTAGPNGREVDAVARGIIEQAGHAKDFGHGLGHGVGLDIHEAPRLSQSAGEEPLVAGNVVTVEPGVYLPGTLGVRIEDLTVVREEGCEVLTGLPKDLTVIG
ncbi:MAG TPA: Xaa-Pro peptidase family protein [Solirubrobacteraceae bacterium]|jgi:Xaa-Pro aminopeptidase|nr:Xaa-Pro peptidase family protein [Solirubrobacteraceae bacterium]